ncbi:hypothetical protein [Laceyella putida]|uniref:DUF2726 domain-containing protein n=1 Tax=Laceyella putida TaxID=110101 RepID=A0ABW2RJ03_9BACL
MAQPGDTFVLFLMLGAIMYVIVMQWIPRIRKKSVPETDAPFRGEVPDLLRENGYEVISGKQKVPLSIEVDGKGYDSRLYIDYIARRDGECYIVIVARERKPLRLSGAGLRDFFLTQYLMYQPDGMLYVDREKRSVKCIQFDLPEVSVHPKPSRNWMAMAGALGVGVLLLWLILL